MSESLEKEQLFTEFKEFALSWYLTTVEVAMRTSTVGESHDSEMYYKLIDKAPSMEWLWKEFKRTYKPQ